MLLSERIQQDAHKSLKEGKKQLLKALRLIVAEQRRVEIDSKSKLDDTQMHALLDKMRKQRQESIRQFLKAGREDLIEIEKYEIAVIERYLPEPLSEQELMNIISRAITDSRAQTVKDMGKVMGTLQKDIAGRADMRQVSNLVRQKLGN